MKNFDQQLSRMKSMMNYGLKTENKNTYSGVEYSKVGADGKTYGIIREGAKYYIKVADKKGNILKEDYNYIGGFTNRKSHEYSSFANAQKQFDLVMASLREASDKKGVIVESWNPDAREYVKVEATQKMREEIARQRQIMQRASLISENKCSEYVDDACKAIEKKNIKNEKHATGDATSANGDPFTEKPEYKDLSESENLAWNDDKEYLDMSHGTEIGDGSPFDKEPNTETEMKNGVVEEGEAMHNTDSIHSPEVGTSERGDDDPFDEPITEDIDQDEEDVEAEDFGEFEDEDDSELEDEFDAEYESFEDLASDDEVEADIDADNSEVEERLANIENLVNAIADKIGASEFDSEPLYDEDEDDVEVEDEAEYDLEFDDDMEDDDFESEEDDDDVEIVESRSYRKLMKEDKLNYFGKHPAYRKSPMQLPPNRNQKFDGYYDMNDEAVEGERPYGQQIGKSDPFTVNPEAITNAIAESVMRRIMRGNKKKH